MDDGQETIRLLTTDLPGRMLEFSSVHRAPFRDSAIDADSPAGGRSQSPSAISVQS